MSECTVARSDGKAYRIGPDRLLCSPAMALIPDHWRPVNATLVFVERGDEVLLIRKKRGHGAGKVNAPGGRLEPGETPADCARREVHEEVGLRCGTLAPAAYLRFHDRTDGYDVRGFVFRTDAFEGDPIETAEASPFWCGWDDVPYDRMWQADRYWLPRVRAHGPVRGDFVFAGEDLVCRSVRPVVAGALRRFLVDFELATEGFPT